MEMLMFDTSPDGIRKLIAQGEGVTVEFKTRFTTDKAIARHLVAFANSQGGIVIFGVGDTKRILGLSRADVLSTLKRTKRLASALLPDSTYDLGEVHVDGRPLVFIAVEQAPESFRPVRIATGDAFALVDNAVVELHSAVLAVTPVDFVH
jgi:predicted HTH transcriptional regulator